MSVPDDLARKIQRFSAPFAPIGTCTIVYPSTTRSATTQQLPSPDGNHHGDHNVSGDGSNLENWDNVVPGSSQEGDPRDRHPPTPRPKRKKAKKSHARPSAATKAPKRTHLPSATQPALEIAHSSLVAGPQSAARQSNYASLSAFDFPVVPGLTDAGDSDAPNELFGDSTTAAEPQPAASKPIQYHSRKRKSAEAQSTAPRPRLPPSFVSSSMHGVEGDPAPSGSDADAIEPLLAKRPKLHATQPARRAVRSPEPDPLPPSPISSRCLPPLPPLPDYPSDSSTDTDPDIPKVLGLAAFQVAPPPRIRPQLTPPPALPSSSPIKPRTPSFSQRMAQTPPRHRPSASAATPLMGRDDDDDDDDDDRMIPSPVPSPPRQLSSSPHRSPLMDHLRRMGGTVDGLSQRPASPQASQSPRSPFAAIDLTASPNSPTGESTTRRPSRRATKQAARDRIKGLHQRYGDFVTLRAHERGVAPRPDEEVAYSQASVLSPTTAAAAAGDGEMQSDDEQSDRAEYQDNYDGGPRIRSPSPIHMPPPRPVMSLGSTRRQRQKVSKRQEPVLRDNANDLFDRMVVRPPRSSTHRSPKATRIERFLHPEPEDPDFVRVGSRSVRTNLASTLASAAKPTSPRSAQRRVYGDLGRKRFRVDRETQDELREVAAEMRRVRERSGEAEKVVKAVMERSKPASRRRGGAGGVRAPGGPSSRGPSKRRDAAVTAASGARSGPSQRRSQLKANHPPRRRVEPQQGDLREPWTQDDLDERSDRSPPRSPPGPGAAAFQSDGSGFDVFQPGAPMLIRRARTSASTRREQYQATLSSRNVLVNALIPSDSCIFSLVAFLSGDSLEYAGVQPAEFGGQVLSVDSVVDYLVSVTTASSNEETASNVVEHAQFSKPPVAVLLAFTSFIDSVDFASLGDSRERLLDALRHLLFATGTQVSRLPALDPIAAFVDLVSFHAWVALWLVLLKDMPSPTAIRPVLTSITKSCPDPLRSPLFDPFQSLLLLSLVGASFPTLDYDPAHVDSAINAVFSSILSTSPTMTDHDQWRIIMLGQALGHAVQPARSFIAWNAVLKFPLGRSNMQPRQESLAFAHVFHLCRAYNWPVDQPVKDALVKFRELYIETAPAPSAGLKLMDLCPPAGESLHPADDAPVPICFLWLVDQVVDAVERDRVVRRLLPVKFTDVPVTAQRLLLALFMRSQLDVMQLVAKLDLSVPLVSVVLPELLDTLTDSVKDQALYLKLLDFTLQRLEADMSVDSQLQAPLVRFLIHAQAQRPALAEDCFLTRHAVFRKLLSAHMPLAVRAAALELVYAILRRHVSLPTHALTLRQATVQVDSQGSMDELMGLSDDVFADVFDSLESNMWKSIADRTRYLLAIVEGTILSHNIHLKVREVDWQPESLPSEIKSFTDLYNAAMTVAAMALKIDYLADAAHFNDMFDKRLGNVRWPSADIPLTVRCARTMAVAIKCFRFGCRLPPAKLDSLFGVVAFSEGVDHLAVPLAISLLLDCQSSMLLRVCAKNLTSISTISRALLLQDVFRCITHDIQTRRRELRSLVYTLTPPLQALVSIAEQLTTLSNRRISHLHDLIAFIDLEASIAGHALPSDLRSLVTKLQVTQPSTVPITGLLKAIQVAATPAMLASVIAGGTGNHPELKQLLDRFDSFFDEGKRDDLATLLVQLFRSRAVGEHERVHGPLDHRPCLGHSNLREKCPLWSPLRAMLAWYLVDRRIKAVRDCKGMIDALDFISASFRQLGDGWCLSELDVLWGQLSLFLTLLQGHMNQSRMVPRAIFDVAALCAHHSSWLDNDLIFPEQGAPLLLSIPRLVFPSAVEQLERLLGFQFGRDRLPLQAWSEHALAFVALSNRGNVAGRSLGHWHLGMQGVLNDDARHQQNDASLCRSIFAFWAVCYHVDPALRMFLVQNQRDLECHLEKNHPALVQDWREHFTNEVGLFCIDQL